MVRDEIVEPASQLRVDRVGTGQGKDKGTRGVMKGPMTERSTGLGGLGGLRGLA